LLSHINLASKNPDFVDPQVLIRGITFIIPRDVLFTPQGITTLYWITLVAGLTALVGLFSRPSLFIFALGNWIFVGHRYSYADVHHPEALFAIFLMTLALAPSGRSLSIDALLRRPRARNAGIHDDDPVGHFQSLFLVMDDKQAGDMYLLVQPAEPAAQLF